MTRSRLVLIGAGVLVLSFVVGWLLGASGRSGAEQAQRQAEMLLDLQTGRARILEARVALYNVNFGDASRLLERAKPALARGRDALTAIGRAADAGSIDRALAAVDEAQRMVGSLDQGANTKLADALEAFKALDVSTVPADGR
jgi:hypothetical protein